MKILLALVVSAMLSMIVGCERTAYAEAPHIALIPDAPATTEAEVVDSNADATFVGGMAFYAMAADRSQLLRESEDQAAYRRSSM